MTNYENKQTDNQDHRLESSINTKDFLIGALIGGIVGAATALFLAPKAGKEIRHEINAGAHTLKEKTVRLGETTRNKSTGIVEVAKEKSSILRESVTKQSNDILNKVKGLKHQNEDIDRIEDREEESVSSSIAYSDDTEIQRKLEETKKAFDETEHQLNH